MFESDRSHHADVGGHSEMVPSRGEWILCDRVPFSAFSQPPLLVRKTSIHLDFELCNCTQTLCPSHIMWEILTCDVSNSAVGCFERSEFQTDLFSSVRSDLIAFPSHMPQCLSLNRLPVSMQTVSRFRAYFVVM